jgi:hypothetical protein
MSIEPQGNTQAPESLRVITARREKTARRVAAKLGITVPVTNRA